MVSFRELRCPNCGAPLRLPNGSAPILSGRTLRCAFCDVLLAPERGGFRPVAPERSDDPLERPSAPRVWLGAMRYWLLGRLGSGESSDVFLAKRDARLQDLVVLKLARTSDQDLLDRGLQLLSKLRAEGTTTSPLLRTLLPAPVASGVARFGVDGRDGSCRAQAFRFKSGFVHTFDEVKKVYPSGVDLHAAVWMTKRLLEVLALVHRQGVGHGSVLPRHLLVHARDHGVSLIGWSRATPLGQPLAATVSDARVFYPAEAWSGAPFHTGVDAAMAARCVLAVLGAPYPASAADAWRAPRSAGLLGAFLEHLAIGAEPVDTAAIRGELTSVAREMLGATSFVPFAMPGWK